MNSSRISLHSASMPNILQCIYQMYDLRRKDSETWNFFLDGNLSVSKCLVSFCSTGVNQALDQENKSMKNQEEKQ